MDCCEVFQHLAKYQKLTVCEIDGIFFHVLKDDLFFCDIIQNRTQGSNI